MKGFHANRDYIFWKKSSPVKLLVDRQRRCLETRRSTSTLLPLPLKSHLVDKHLQNVDPQQNVEQEHPAQMYFSPATSRSCHPALMLVHSFCLCFNTPNLMRIDLLTYRVQGHIETHTSKWFRSSPLVQDSHGLWKMLIVGFGHS